MTEADKVWSDFAETRLHEVENGKETIPDDRFFAAIMRGRGWQE